MGRKNLPFYERVTIEDLAAEGKAIARVNDLVVFVRGAVPGDIVDLQVIRKRKSYREARITKFHGYSEVRTQPFCAHFGICGGCKWQQLPYDEQLKYKEKQVKDALSRIAKIAPSEFLPILGSEKETFYRNKLEFTFSNHRWLTEEETNTDIELPHRNGLGFHVPERFDRIVDVNTCFLQEDPSNAIRNRAREFALRNNMSFYDHRTNEGLLRNLIIRTSKTREIMVVLSVQFDDPLVYKMLDDIYNEIPGITSLMYVINPKKNETLYDQDILVHRGRDHIIETLENLRFIIGPKSFFQTNSFQALQLYKITRDFAGLSGKELVYDLYTGTGTIANFVAGKAEKVVGIESVPEAIIDARRNSELNGIGNTDFFAGDMKDILNDDFIAEHGRPDVVITDPPRAGMHEHVVRKILEIEPGTIVYVSCNPATQARDIQILSERYTAEKSRPVDMFPHTHHIENVMLMKRKS